MPFGIDRLFGRKSKESFPWDKTIGRPEDEKLNKAERVRREKAKELLKNPNLQDSRFSKAREILKVIANRPCDNWVGMAGAHPEMQELPKIMENQEVSPNLFGLVDSTNVKRWAEASQRTPDIFLDHLKRKAETVPLVRTSL